MTKRGRMGGRGTSAVLSGPVAVLDAPAAPEPILYVEDVVALFGTLPNGKPRVSAQAVRERFLPEEARYASKYKYWPARLVYAALASGEHGLASSRNASAQAERAAKAS